jgi:hypothetical protein
MSSIKPSDTVSLDEGMTTLQLHLDDDRFLDCKVDIGEPIMQSRWKNFRKPRRLVNRWEKVELDIF